MIKKNIEQQRKLTKRYGKLIFFFSFYILSLSLPLSHSLSLPLTVSLSHTYTHTLFMSPYITPFLPSPLYFLSSLFLSLSLTRTLHVTLHYSFSPLSSLIPLLSLSRTNEKQNDCKVWFLSFTSSLLSSSLLSNWI